MVSVKVCWRQTGKPAKGRRIVVSFDGLTRGITETKYSDDNGDAHFDAAPGSGKVYVDGSTAFTGRVEGRVVVYI